MTPETSTLTIPAESEQAMIVRQFVRLACHRYGIDGATDNVLQVTEELVANAMTGAPAGAEPTVEIRLIPLPAAVRVEVHDRGAGVGGLPPGPGPGHPTGGDADEDDSAERHGLSIVATLARAWGVVKELYGKVVWAEIGATQVEPIAASPVLPPSGAGARPTPGTSPAPAVPPVEAPATTDA